jgi:tetratricopeptide (TPR) repeat protein/O-antigen ligase
VIEAGWLGIAISIPLFFNIYSNTVFDPDKANLLRAIAFLMGGAWLVRRLTRAPSPAEPSAADGSTQPGGEATWRRLLRARLALPVLFLIAVEAASTAFSVLPQESLWGSFTRGQGLVVSASYLLLFALVATGLRRPGQWDRLRFALVVPSVPILIYGFLQRAGQDPVPWTVSQEERIGSTLGNPIFLGAYLIMILFITGEGLIAAVRTLRTARQNGESPGLGDRIAGAAYGLLLVLQLVALVMTRSRGPVLALLAALFIVGLVGVVRLRGLAGARSGVMGPWAKKARRAFVALLVVVVLVVGFLAAVGAPGSPLASFERLPSLNRLAGVFDLGHRTVRIRRGIWEGVSQLALPHEPLRFSDGESDRWNAIRPILGTGPETLYSAFGRFHAPELAQIVRGREVPDRSHNEILDSWATMGVLGLFAHLLLFGSFFYYALRCLGLVEGRRERLFFGGSLAILGLAGAAIPWSLLGNHSLVGIGIPLGFLAALAIYISSIGFRRIVERPWDRTDMLVLAILAANLTHFVEIQFGLALTTNRMLFWLLTGVLAAVAAGRLRLEGSPAAAPEEATAGATAPQEHGASQARRRKKGKGKKRPKKFRRRSQSTPTSRLTPPPAGFWPYALMTALVVMTVGFSLIVNLAQLRRAPAVMISAFTEIWRGNQGVPSLGLLWLLLFSLAAALALARPKARGSQASKLFITSLGIALVSLFLFSVSLARVMRLTRAQGDSLLFPVLLSQHLIWYYALASVVLFGLALTLALGRSERLRSTSSPARSYSLLAVAGLAIWLFALSPASKAMRASVLVKQGVNFEHGKQWALSEATFERALAVRGDVDQFHLYHGRAASELAKREDSLSRREELFREAIVSLERAQSLNRLRYHHPANLARNYKLWAGHSVDPKREARLRRSLGYFETAIEMSPGAVELYVQSAEAYLAVGRPGEARTRLETALAINPDHAAIYTNLGELTVAEATAAEQAGDSQLARRKREDAIEVLEQAVERQPRLATAHNVLSTLYSAVGRKQEAIAAAERYAELNPTSSTAYSNLAKLYEWTRQYEKALADRWVERRVTVIELSSQAVTRPGGRSRPPRPG